MVKRGGDREGERRLKGVHELGVGCARSQHLFAAQRAVKRVEKLDEPLANFVFNRAGELVGFGDVRDEPFFVLAVLQSRARGGRFPQHALVHVPGEEVFDARALRFLASVGDHITAEGTRAVGRVRHFDFARDDSLTIFVQ